VAVNYTNQTVTLPLIVYMLEVHLNRDCRIERDFYSILLDIARVLKNRLKYDLKSNQIRIQLVFIVFFWGNTEYHLMKD
jgi:hypothetical protein